jgi:Methyltransferase domain
MPHPSAPKPPVGGWKVSSRWEAQDAFALEAMRPLGEAFLPWTGYSISPAAILKILTLAEFHRPSVILELGAGLSTVFLARFARYRGFAGTRIVSVDNDEAWLALVTEYLEREDLQGHVDLVHARRISWQPSETAATAPDRAWDFELPDKWYDPSAIRDALRGDKVDMMLVDGPKGRGTITRYPALAELIGELGDGCTVVLDDAQRAPEQEIVARWEELSGMEFQLQPEVKLAVGRPPRQPTQPSG